MRSNYTEDIDNWELIRWRGCVASATRGQRGQRLLRELLAALDALPEKRLIVGEFVQHDGDVCTLGAVLVARKTLHPNKFEDDNASLAEELDVAECLVQEIEYQNDESGGPMATPEMRWAWMRAWVVGALHPDQSASPPLRDTPGD